MSGSIVFKINIKIIKNTRKLWIKTKKNTNNIKVNEKSKVIIDKGLYKMIK